MVLIDFLNKTIPGGAKISQGGGQPKNFRAPREIFPAPPPVDKILCTRLLSIYLSIYPYI